MSTDNLKQVISGDPGVMLVINSADLKNAVCAIYAEAREDYKRELETYRERPALSRADAMEALKVSSTTLHPWNVSGYLKPVKVGARSMYRASDIAAILEKGGVSV